MQQIRGLLFYVGVGFLVHVLLIGDTINVMSALAIGVLLAWPVALAVTYPWWTLVCVVAFFAISALVNHGKKTECEKCGEFIRG